MDPVKKTAIGLGIAFALVILVIIVFTINFDDPRYEGLTESQISEIKKIEFDCDIQRVLTDVQGTNATFIVERCEKVIQNVIAKYRALNENP